MSHLKTYLLIAAMTALFGVVGLMLGGPGGMMVALLIAVGMNIFAYWNSDKMVLATYRAEVVDPNTATGVVRDYYDDIVVLAKRANLPMPRAYIVPNDQPNAFATGRNPQNAAVAATYGLLNMLSRDEIKAVMAHELAHVKNRDTLTMTITATFAGAISSIANFAMFFGGNRDDEEGGSNIIVVILMSILAPIAAMVVQMAISRAREYEADRIGAEICGDPNALAKALQKIDDFAHRRINYQAEHNPASAHMFIINPLSGRGMDNLFSTHPATANRVHALMELAQGLKRKNSTVTYGTGVPETK